MSWWGLVDDWEVYSTNMRISDRANRNYLLWGWLDDTKTGKLNRDEVRFRTFSCGYIHTMPQQGLLGTTVVIFLV